MNKLLCLGAAALLGLTTIGCDVDQTEEGALPDVDVNATPGNMPEYDLEGPDVDASMEEKTVTVPDVDVSIPDENDNE